MLALPPTLCSRDLQATDEEEGGRLVRGTIVGATILDALRLIADRLLTLLISAGAQLVYTFHDPAGPPRLAAQSPVSGKVQTVLHFMMAIPSA